MDSQGSKKIDTTDAPSGKGKTPLPPFYNREGMSPFGYHVDDPQFALPTLPGTQEYPDPEKCALVPKRLGYGNYNKQEFQKGNAASWWEKAPANKFEPSHSPPPSDPEDDDNSPTSKRKSSARRGKRNMGSGQMLPPPQPTFAQQGYGSSYIAPPTTGISYSAYNPPPAMPVASQSFGPGLIPPLPQVPAMLSRGMYVVPGVIVKPADKRMTRRFAGGKATDHPLDSHPRLDWEYRQIPRRLSTGRKLTDRQILLLFRGERSDAHELASDVLNDRGEFYRNYGYLCCMSDAFLYSVGLTRNRIPPTVGDRPDKRAAIDAHNQGLWQQKFGARGVDFP